MQINNVRARLFLPIFLPKTSIFTHFFQIYAHACAKKAVILQREIMSLSTGCKKEKI